MISGQDVMTDKILSCPCHRRRVAVTNVQILASATALFLYLVTEWGILGLVTRNRISTTMLYNYNVGKSELSMMSLVTWRFTL